MIQLQRLARILVSLSVLGLFAIQATAERGSSTRILPFVDNLERWSYDLRLQSTLEGGIDERIVIVHLNEKSLQDIGHWPWRRDVMATLVSNLFDHYNISMIGFDMVFAEAYDSPALQVLETLEQGDLKQDLAFKNAVKELKPQLQHDALFAESLAQGVTVLGFVAAQQSGSNGTLPAPLNVTSTINPAILPIYEREGLTGNVEVLQKATPDGGFFDNPALSDDGIFRRVPLIYRHNDEIYPSLALAMMLALYGDRSIDLILEAGTRDLSAIAISAVRDFSPSLPVDEQGAILIPYRGPSPSFPYISASDIINKTAPLEILDGATVLFGATAPGLLDLRASPIQPIYPGVEIHANVLAGIMSILANETTGGLRSSPSWVLAYELSVLLLIGFIMAFSLAWVGPLLGIAISLLLLGLDIAGNLYAWHANLVLPIASHLALILSLFLFNTAYGYLIESRGKRRLGQIFGQYVPPEIVSDMSQRGGDFGLKGESREMTVLFSDVRGFTTISEGLAPDELTELMNAFLTPMTASIHDHKGTIDKYMGDAIMAFWGAPIRTDLHADRALQTALDMNHRLMDLKSEFAQRGWPPIEIGIGLNTGAMNVGNMGSEFRMAYTVLGDAVNLGSRLEGLTKNYGIRIIVSDATRQAAPGYIYREIDKVRVKGKLEPVAIFEPLKKDNDVANANNINSELQQKLEQLDQYHQALVFYRQQQWEDADKYFRQLLTLNPDSVLYRLYLDRIQQLRIAELPENWDAVYVFTTK